MCVSLFALSFALVPEYTISPEPRLIHALQLADVDGDGDLDAALAHGVSPPLYGVSVLLGRRTRVLSQPLPYELTFSSGVDLRIADINNDRRPDLIVIGRDADGMRGLNLLLGQGEGRFGAPRVVGPWETVNGVDVADLNGDGRLDLVVGTSAIDGEPPLAVLFGRGDGSFWPPVERMGPFSVGQLAAGDMNGDGAADIVADLAGPLDGEAQDLVGVFLNDGSGRLAAPLTRRVPSDAEEIVLFDADRDGRLDVAARLRSRDAVAVLLGEGNGKLGRATRYATGRDPVSLAVGDVDRDGWPDLVTADAGDEAISVISLGAPGGAARRWRLPLRDRPAAVALGNMDRDPGLEIVSVSREGGQATVIALRERMAW